MADTYTCACCNGEFEKGWTDEEAAAEKEEKFGDMSYDEMSLVCDNCYESIMAKAEEYEKNQKG